MRSLYSDPSFIVLAILAFIMLATNSDGMPQRSQYYGSGLGQIGGGWRRNTGFGQIGGVGYSASAFGGGRSRNTGSGAGGGRRGNSGSGGSYPAPPPPPPPSSGSGGKQTKCVERYNGRCTCWEDEYGKLCA